MNVNQQSRVADAIETANAYGDPASLRSKMGRALWNAVWLLLYRPSPVPFHAWRRFLLRCFGARIAVGARIYPRCRIWAPWNLTMERDSCMANDVDCYSVSPVKLGAQAIVSQYTYLCTASRDYNDPDFGLITKAIEVGDYAWVGAQAFIGPGVKIGEGAVIGATASVYHDVPEWCVVSGNPARLITRRARAS